MSKPRKKVLGITMGDPCGIGPEIILRALGNRRARAAARFLVFGSAEILQRVSAAHSLRMPHFERVQPSDSLQDRRGPFLMEGGRCPARLALLARATADQQALVSFHEGH